MSQPYPPQPPHAPGPAPTGAHAGYAPAAARATTNPLGVIAAIIGAVPLLFQLVQPFASLALVNSVGYEVYSVVTAIINGLSLVLGLAALALGIVAALRPGLPRLFAGIGIGLGVAAVWGSLVAFLYPVVMQFAY